MMGTINCVYETPCGWCSKWDKKCDNKTSKEKPCFHTWIEAKNLSYIDETGKPHKVYKCVKCGEEKIDA